MREAEFEKYLIGDDAIISKTKAVASRMSRARAIERHFNKSLDSIVSDDEQTYIVLLQIKAKMNDHNGNLSNALRKYYIFANGKSFPSLSEYANKKVIKPV